MTAAGLSVLPGPLAPGEHAHFVTAYPTLNQDCPSEECPSEEDRDPNSLPCPRPQQAFQNLLLSGSVTSLAGMDSAQGRPYLCQPLEKHTRWHSLPRRTLRRTFLQDCQHIQVALTWFSSAQTKTKTSLLPMAYYCKSGVFKWLLIVYKLS